jgi:membrane fusion protein, multidrug efflux system
MCHLSDPAAPNRSPKYTSKTCSEFHPAFPDLKISATAMRPFVLLLLSAAALHAQTPVKTAVAAKGDIHRWITIPGSLRPNQQATLYAKVAGYLGAINVDKGDKVAAGAELARIEVPEMESDLKRQEAEARLAATELTRLTAARTKSPDLVIARDIDKALAALDAANAGTERTRTMLAYAKLTAPFAGTITARFVDAGAFVPAATTGSTPQNAALLTLMDTGTLRAQASVPEVDSIFIQNGLPVRILPDAMPGKIFEAKVSRSSGALDEATRTLLVEADLPNADGKLKPGQFASIKFAVEKHTGTLVIPVDALVMEKANAFVFRVAGGKAKKSPVTAGFNDGTQVEITAGLQPGEEVILAGKLVLADGQPVTVAASKP